MNVVTLYGQEAKSTVTVETDSHMYQEQRDKSNNNLITTLVREVLDDGKMHLVRMNCQHLIY